MYTLEITTITKCWIMTLVLFANIMTNSDAFNRTFVILNSHGHVTSVTNITSSNVTINEGSSTSDSEQQAILGQQNCQCMGFRDCINKKGSFLTYCESLENKVCCFLEISNVSTNPVKVSGNCGVPSIPTNLDGVAQFKEWPWHVAIVEAKDDLYICGGSLISATRILTAAHCLLPYVSSKGSRSRLKIRAGEYDVSTNSESIPHIEVLVAEMILHPNFDKETLQNDIAVIHLARPILPEFRENIMSVCLPKEFNDTTLRSRNSSLKRCVITGWGRKTESSEHSRILKEIVVPLWENEVCEQSLQWHFGPMYSLPTSALCAGDEGRDACGGDGGGPLVCFENGVWIQEGIVSFGIGCGRRKTPGIYTRVASYTEFLESQMKKLE